MLASNLIFLYLCELILSYIINFYNNAVENVLNFLNYLINMDSSIFANIDVDSPAEIKTGEDEYQLIGNLYYTFFSLSKENLQKSKVLR